MYGYTGPEQRASGSVPKLKFGGEREGPDPDNKKPHGLASEGMRWIRERK